jgi:hypothetical protein
MNKSAAFYSAVLFALAPLPHAGATVVFTFDPNATRVIDGNLATYTLSFTNTSPGGIIAGFAGNFNGNNAFSGPMTQQLAAGALPTPTADFDGQIDEAIDSHFLVTNSQILSAVAPFESAANLGGAFTLNVSARTQTKALVQIVANVNDRIFYDFGLSEAIGAGSITPNFSGVLGVPEPSSLALAAVTLPSLSAARRRPIVSQRTVGG